MTYFISCSERRICSPYECYLITYLLTYSLTHSTVQSPWAANWFTASQEIPRISRNPKVHYRTHKLPPPVSILGQPNLVHIPTPHLLEIRPNIIQPSTPKSSQWSPSLRFPHQHPIQPPLFLLRLPSILHSVNKLQYVKHSEDVGERGGQTPLSLNPSAWGHLNPSSYWDVGRLFLRGI